MPKLEIFFILLARFSSNLSKSPDISMDLSADALHLIVVLAELLKKS